MNISLERRGTTKPWLLVAVPIGSVVVGLIVGGLFLAFTGRNPFTIYSAITQASFTTTYGVSDTLATATPLILTALAAALAFKVNLYQIGAEGQLYLGAIFSAAAGAALGSAPALIALPLVILAGAVGGAAWIFLPALFRARFGTSEILTTLMFNFVALYLARYLIYGSASYWRDPTSKNFPQGKQLQPSTWLPKFGTQSVNWGFLISLLAALAIWVLLNKTRFGYSMRVLGDAPDAARYSGIPVRRMTMSVLLLSGALAGLAGATEVAGRAHALDPNGLAIGIGYAGIIVAALARLNPFGVIVIAIGFGGLQNSATSLQSLGADSVPPSIATLLQGIILLLALAGELFIRYGIRIRKEESLKIESSKMDVVS